jgi:hypothetical protein
MANESGGIRLLLIIILTRTGHSSINSLSFPPSLPPSLWLELYVWIRFFGFVDFGFGFVNSKLRSELWIMDFYYGFSFLSDASAHRKARRDSRRDFRSFIIITTTVVYREVGRIHQ